MVLDNEIEYALPKWKAVSVMGRPTPTWTFWVEKELISHTKSSEEINLKSSLV